MNEHSLQDPQLRSLEARLAAAAPQSSHIEQQQLLYQCAFAAGQQVGRKSLQSWRVAAATLVVLCCGLSVPLAHDRWKLEEPARELPTATKAPSQPMLAYSEVPFSARPSAAVDLDAWQMPHSERMSLSDELAQFRRTDPHLRSLAMGTFTRAMLQP
jgi:hypothetical protein